MYEISFKKKFVKEKINLNCKFSFEKGEFISLYGKLNSGNKRLLSLIDGTFIPDEGYINSDTKADLNIVSLDEHLKYINNKNIKNNMYIAVGKKNRKFADEILEKLELKKFEKLYPSAVNQREYEKFKLGMCLAKSPDILLIHKPLKSFCFDIEKKLEYFYKKYKFTIISLINDFKNVPKLASRVLFIHNGEINKTITLKEAKRKNIVIA